MFAIFIHGCFWHRCKRCKLSYPKTNTEFWKNKFERNINRDKIKEEQLISLNWKVMTIWECEINKDINECVKKLKNNMQ